MGKAKTDDPHNTHDHHDHHDKGWHALLRADEGRWRSLVFVGIQECFELRGPGVVIELRNCTCGSTLGRRRNNKEAAMKFEVYRNKANEYRWRLLASNGLLAADSGEGYTWREDAHRAIAALLKEVNNVVIVDD